jgi:nucleotide-binding universal stress UspA family protein
MEPPSGSAPVLAAFCPRTGACEPLEFAAAVGRGGGRPIIVVAVVAGSGVGHLELQRLRRRLRGLDVRVLVDDRPDHGLARALDELAPAMIVLGARAGLPRLGPTARRVLHVSSCPVAIVPRGYARPPAGALAVGVAFFPGPEARPAIRAAAALVQPGDGRLRVVSALEPGAAAGTAAVRDAVAVLAPGVEPAVEVPAGGPVDGLVAASAGLDVLVMGSRASGPPSAVRLGSVSRAVLDRAACPVLVVPRGAPAATSARRREGVTPIG